MFRHQNRGVAALRVVMAGLVALAAVPRAHAAWARVPIAEYPSRIAAMSIARFDGKKILAISESNGDLHLLHWNGSAWKEVRHKIRALPRMTFLSGRNDGVDRLYASMRDDGQVVELTLKNGLLEQRPIALPGVGTDSIAGTVSNVDGEARLYVNRAFNGGMSSQDGTCASSTRSHPETLPDVI